MASLHVINVSPDHPRLSECLGYLRHGDTLLLTEDAVMALADQRIDWPAGITLRALSPDLAARGLDPGRLSVDATPVSYGEFVTLTLESNKVICW
ncbi:tRNA 2-thiouridine synthesizing protein B [Tamilnaduibacter salinus]|uniref:tRNA 2-thiouridine synthesizing protein B n=1 Tax=Tamilnaduibacter salinus TaxID=1484056 RepID=A0A2U1CZH8_9GAMM|nr:sulfurtransferase complex subunit TusB [Tamilnaduibacter salinus]PVY78198.1 tRNA 2-thiouridine synthesizing protein B [Tamilnaduibacter salinus]